MGKWLAIAAVALLVLFIILWRELDESSATTRSAADDKPTASEHLPITAAAPAPKKVEKAAVPETKPATPSNLPPPPPGKQWLDTGSDMMYQYFLDIVPKRIWKDAAICYEGKVGTRLRDAKMKFAFNVVVKNGKAIVQDVHVANDEDGKPVNTIGDAAIESCFYQHVSRYQWDANSDMPDGYAMPDYSYPDELVIRPERSKKYYKDNMEYVGDEAPRQN